MVKDFSELVPRFALIQLSFWLLSRSSPVSNQECVKVVKV